LAGIVVNNGIILIDFVQSNQRNGVKTREAIVNGSSTRFTPIILTAGTTVLGLLPMAVAMNINFASFFSTFDPQIFFGGDTGSFWGTLELDDHLRLGLLHHCDPDRGARNVLRVLDREHPHPQAFRAFE
jgi:hypothetical protein